MKNFKFLIYFAWQCRTMVVPLALIMCAATVLFLEGYKGHAWVVGTLGTISILATNLIYVVVSDPGRQWPGLSVGQRLRKLFGL